MTTERIHEFIVLAKLLNYSKAAENLYVTQSVLSRHIMDMEKELGVTLFLRNTHGVNLTDEGRFFLREIEPIFRDYQNSLTVMQSGNLSADGNIILRCSDQCLNTKALSFLQNFQDKYQNISMQIHPIHEASSRNLILTSDIFISPCDLTDFLKDGEEGILLSTQSACLILPPRHPFGAMQAISLSDLREESLIVPYAQELFGPYSRNALLTSRRTHGNIHIIPVDSPGEALLLTELGKGLAIIPHHLKHRLYPHTRAISIYDTDCNFPIFCYINRNRSNPASDLFYEHIQKFFST